MAQSPQDLKGFLLGFQQAWRVGTQPVEGVPPAVAGGGAGVDPIAGRIEVDSLPGDLLDHRSLGEVILECLAGRQQAVSELQEAELEERVLLVLPDGPDAVLGTDVAEEEEEHQRVGLVSAHLKEAAAGDVRALGGEKMPEVLGTEEVARLGRGQPGRLAPPFAHGGQGLDLPFQPLQAIVPQTVQAVVDDSGHALSLPRSRPNSVMRLYQLLLPGLGLDVDLQPAVTCRQQKLAPPRRLEALALNIAELKRPLQLLCLSGPLCSEEAERRVGRDHQTRFAGKQVAGVLGGEPLSRKSTYEMPIKRTSPGTVPGLLPPKLPDRLLVLSEEVLVEILDSWVVNDEVVDLWQGEGDLVGEVGELMGELLDVSREGRDEIEIHLDSRKASAVVLAR